MMRFLPSLILLSLCLSLSSCGDTSKKGPSQAEEKLFVETYVRLARAVQDYGDDPEDLAKARKAVFHQMGLDQERFAALTEKLEESPERWAVVWEQIVERLQEEQEQEEEGG